MRTSYRVAIGAVTALAVLGPLAYFWVGSLVPSTYDMSAMGRVDFGGGPALAHGGTMSVASLTGPTTGTPAVNVTLTAQRQKNGRITVNGTSPGPELRAVKGQLVQVTLVNDNIGDGITLHWHGVDVPNAEDGVAGITQNAVKPGQRYVYRFVAQHAGTYWYHSHQVSHEQVRDGLFGALIISDKSGMSGNGKAGVALGGAGVPGGAGVFETAMLQLLPMVDRTSLAAAFLGFRVFYYFAPLAVALILLAFMKHVHDPDTEPGPVEP